MLSSNNLNVVQDPPPVRADAELSDIKYPGIHDVLSGRGGHSMTHQGNLKFRMLIDACKPRYYEASKFRKAQLASDIVTIWRSQEPMGRFLTKSKPLKEDSLWHDIGNKAAVKKVAQALREKRSYPVLNLGQQSQQTEQGSQQSQPQQQSWMHPTAMSQQLLTNSLPMTNIPNVPPLMQNMTLPSFSLQQLGQLSSIVGNNPQQQGRHQLSPQLPSSTNAPVVPQQQSQPPNQQNQDQTQHTAPKLPSENHHQIAGKEAGHQKQPQSQNQQHVQDEGAIERSSEGQKQQFATNSSQRVTPEALKSSEGEKEDEGRNTRQRLDQQLNRENHGNNDFPDPKEKRKRKLRKSSSLSSGTQKASNATNLVRDEWEKLKREHKARGDSREPRRQQKHKQDTKERDQETAQKDKELNAMGPPPSVPPRSSLRDYERFPKRQKTALNNTSTGSSTCSLPEEDKAVPVSSVPPRIPSATDHDQTGGDKSNSIRTTGSGDKSSYSSDGVPLSALSSRVFDKHGTGNTSSSVVTDHNSTGGGGSANASNLMNESVGSFSESSSSERPNNELRGSRSSSTSIDHDGSTKPMIDKPVERVIQRRRRNQNGDK